MGLFSRDCGYDEYRAALVAAYNAAIPLHRRATFVSPGQMSMEIAHRLDELHAIATSWRERHDKQFRQSAKQAAELKAERDEAKQVAIADRQIAKAYEAQFWQKAKECGALRTKLTSAEAEREQARTERDEARKERGHYRAATENALFERDTLALKAKNCWAEARTAMAERDAALKEAQSYRQKFETAQYYDYVLAQAAAAGHIREDMEKAKAETEKAKADARHSEATALDLMLRVTVLQDDLNVAKRKLAKVKDVVAPPRMSPSHGHPLGSIGRISAHFGAGPAPLEK